MSSHDAPPPEQPAARSDSGRGNSDDHQELGRSPSASTIPRVDRTGLGSDDSSILSLSPDLKGVEREGASEDPELAKEATDRGRPYVEFMKAEMYFHETGDETSTDVTAMSAVASVTIVPLRRRFASARSARAFGASFARFRRRRRGFERQKMTRKRRKINARRAENRRKTRA